MEDRLLSCFRCELPDRCRRFEDDELLDSPDELRVVVADDEDVGVGEVEERDDERCGERLERRGLGCESGSLLMTSSWRQLEICECEGGRWNSSSIEVVARFHHGYEQLHL